MDILCCDVIPMKGCHLLLEWLWLYDRWVRYDGYGNTYSFAFNGRKVTLQPMKINDLDTNKRGPSPHPSKIHTRDP